MNFKISVIVPIYNAEFFLHRCLDSIVNQTYKNLEIVLVNDGSTDESLAICEQFKKRDSRIIVIEQENKGVSKARNKGLEIATGSYIGFVDSDDFIDVNMYDEMLSSIIDNDADIAECGYVTCDEKQRIIKNYPLKNELLESNSDCIYSYLTKNNTTNFNVNKLFKSSLIKTLRYPDYKYSEDYWFNANAFYLCERKITIAKPLYYYVQHSNSAVNGTFNLSHKMDVFRSGESVFELYRKEKPEYLTFIALYICNYVLNYTYLVKVERLQVNKKHLCAMNEIFLYYYAKINKNKLNFRERISLFLFRINSSMFTFVKTIYQKNKTYNNFKIY